MASQQDSAYQISTGEAHFPFYTQSLPSYIMDRRLLVTLSPLTCTHMEGLEKCNLPRAPKVATFVKTVSETC